MSTLPLTGSNFDVNQYDYELPEDLIAQKPLIPRDSSRLLVIHRKENRWEHRLFKEFPIFLDSQDQVVVNNTRVMKARLTGIRIRKVLNESTGGGKVEFVLLEEIESKVWEGLFHASGKATPGFQFEIPTPDGKGLRGVIIRGSSASPSGTVVAQFDRDPIESGAGEVPIPHYIQESSALEDETHYQTIYAKTLGSAAAPTAGFHFTDRTRTSLENRGVKWSELTLHVGLGTFRPVRVADIRQHPMHSERYEIPLITAKAISDWKQQGKRIVAVGTTTVRTLESAWQQNSGMGQLQSGIGRTSLFICPGYEYKIVDRILTNFHLPGSTLLMLVSAFAGRKLVMAAYQEAVSMKYRFFSYGDAMLIL